MMVRPVQSCLLFLVGVMLTDTLSAADASSRTPNVILVMCDDLGWGDVGFNGAAVVRTPHLDEMAARSLRFTRFYAAAPVCSPTRGSALTGRHPYRYGITSANVGHLPPEEMTLAAALQTRGYATGLFGKWHLGTLTTRVRDANRGGPRGTQHYATPAMHGFDVYFATESKVPTWDPLLVPRQFGPQESRRYGWSAVEEPAQAEFYGTRYWEGEERAVVEDLRGDDSRVIMDRALAFIEGAVRQGRPFLAVIWFHTPHLPVVTGAPYRALYADRPLAEQLYFGCITAMDEQIGRLRKALRDREAAEDTLIWFASDNGPETGTPGRAGPFRGRKRSLYEGGVRVPALLEWPARIPQGRTTDLPCVTSDYYPTVLDVLGLDMPGQPTPIDGVSLRPLIDGALDQRPRPIGFQSGGMQAWSDNRYKLVISGPSARPELYDLLDDPGETTDLAARHPERVETMRRRLREWVASCAASAQGDDYRVQEPQ